MVHPRARAMPQVRQALVGHQLAPEHPTKLTSRFPPSPRFHGQVLACLSDAGHPDPWLSRTWCSPFRSRPVSTPSSPTAATPNPPRPSHPASVRTPSLHEPPPQSYNPFRTGPAIRRKALNAGRDPWIRSADVRSHRPHGYGGSTGVLGHHKRLAHHAPKHPRNPTPDPWASRRPRPPRKSEPTSSEPTSEENENDRSQPDIPTGIPPIDDGDHH